MRQYKEYILCAVVATIYGLCVFGTVGMSLAGTFDAMNKPQGVLTVNKTGDPVTFSVYSYSTSAVNTHPFFHNCTNLKLENGGAWFTTETGKCIYIQGNFWIEGPLKPE